ncbi:urease accessory protein UreD [Paracoccus jiaweipingae]|uniref:urease accessory protein UreD n=1 Tax=unclassified Paracoccus (in: a-proteobacteria) TaxID=2688777 RepID=UPI0037A5E984
MLDTTPPRPALQRSHGSAHVALDGGRLTGLAQSGSAKLFLPPPRAARPEVVFLNTSGGLASGDRLDYAVTLAAGTQASATTQTAERAYRADGPPARASVRLRLGRGAALDWLPQDTILFDGAALDRRLEAELEEDSTLLMTETLVLGRAAMGETVTRLDLHDRRIVRRAGRPVLVDPLRLDDAALAGDGAARLAGARAIGFLALIGPGAADALAPLRALLDQPGVTAAASASDGRLVLRCLAGDGWPLRRQMIRLIDHLRPGAVPRVWQI